MPSRAFGNDEAQATGGHTGSSDDASFLLKMTNSKK